MLVVALAFATCAGAAGVPCDWRWSGVERVVAIGDVHGAYEQLVALLQRADLVDGELRWNAGKTHLVFTGDLLDRGPGERKVLDLVMRLEDEAAAAGGQVHVLLGNHEVLNLIGDLRYVPAVGFASFADLEPPGTREAALSRFTREGAGAEASPAETGKMFEELYPPGYFGRRAAFAPTGKYGAWLLTKPALIVINDVAFVHGGLPPVVAELGGAELNARVNDELRQLLAARENLARCGLLDPEARFLESFEQVAGRTARLEDSAAAPGCAGTAGRDGPAYMRAATALAIRSDGPLWYRGTSLNDEEAEIGLFQAALARLEVTRAVVGHTVTAGNRVSSRFGGRLLRIDTGMLDAVYQGRPAALLLSAGQAEVLYVDTETAQAPVIEPTSLPEAVATAVVSDQELEDFLRTAEIVKDEEIGQGITRPRRVTLKKNGQTRRAAFKTVNESKSGKVQLGKRVEMVFTDRYAYEVAAYKLDRLIGLRMVPVTVLRTINGQQGSLQSWVESAVDERRRLQQKLDPYEPSKVDEAKNLMHLFDALIYNVDRNQTNVLFTPGDWHLHLIDHSRAFRLNTDRPPGIVGHPIHVPPEIRKPLAALDLPTLQRTLGDLLSRAQMKAILERRDALLDSVEAGAAATTSRR